MARKQYNKKYLTACLSKGVRPKDMPYAHYEQFAKAEKTAPMSQDDYDDMDEDDGEEEKTSPATGEPTKGAAARKSEAGGDEPEQTVDSDRLSKALEAYETVETALGTAGSSRETYLQARYDAGTISKAEKAELGQIWAKGDEAGGDEGGGSAANLRKSVSAQLAEDPDAEALINASEFVKSLVDATSDAIEGMSAEVTQQGTATRELLKAQGGLVKALLQDQIANSKVMRAQGEIIKALGERLGMVERTPTTRRAQGSHNPRDVRGRDMSKGGSSVADGTHGDQLTKSQVNTGLRNLMVKADTRGDKQAKEQIAQATALYETNGQLKPHIEAAVRQEIGALS